MNLYPGAMRCRLRFASLTLCTTSNSLARPGCHMPSARGTPQGRLFFPFGWHPRQRDWSSLGQASFHAFHRSIERFQINSQIGSLCHMRPPSFFKQVISIIPLLFHSENRQNKISANKKIPAQFIADAGISIGLHLSYILTLFFLEVIFWTRCLFKLEPEGGGCVSFLLNVLSGILANIISGKF